MADTFLKKMVQMLSNENNEFIKWNETGDSIIISDSNKFAREILPKYFKTKKFNSFVRQLNFYGFRKVPASKSSKGCEFTHKLFRKGCENKVINMRRKVIHELDMETLNQDLLNIPSEYNIDIPSPSPSPSPVPIKNVQLDEKDIKIKELSERCRQLEAENNQLKEYFNSLPCSNPIDNNDYNYEITSSNFLNDTFGSVNDDIFDIGNDYMPAFSVY